jgi:hypothetical protein
MVIQRFKAALSHGFTMPLSRVQVMVHKLINSHKACIHWWKDESFSLYTESMKRKSYPRRKNVAQIEPSLTSEEELQTACMLTRIITGIYWCLFTSGRRTW